MLSIFYECKEKIAVIRNPFSNSLEGKTRKREDNESVEESKILDNAYVFFERYDREKEPFIKLRTLKFRFMTIFGKETGEHFDEIIKILNAILFSARTLGQRHWKEQGRRAFSEEEFQKHLKEMNDHEKNIWATFEGNDEIINRIDNCITKIENCCKSVITK